MKLQPIRSSLIAAIGWENFTLYIKMKGGRAYKYTDVPIEVYLAALGYSSAGVWYNECVKGKYESQPWNPEQENDALPKAETST
jgi:hypothetical protein